MIEPYNAVGLIPTFWGIRRRDDIQNDVIDKQVALMHKRGIWKKPSK